MLADWCDSGTIVPPHHGHSSDRRKGLCWTSAEVAELIKTLAAHSLIIKHNNEWRRTALRPDSNFTRDLVSRFNEIWRRESAGK